MNTFEESDSESFYTLEMIAMTCAVSMQTILEYHEEGLLCDRGAFSVHQFDDDTIHRLRTIERLRHEYEMNFAALRLTLNLMDEIERLHKECRVDR